MSLCSLKPLVLLQNCEAILETTLHGETPVSPTPFPIFDILIFIYPGSLPPWRKFE